MKKVLLSLAVMAMATTTAMGQAMNPGLGQVTNPVLEKPQVNPAQVKTVKEENLKGYVLAVKYGNYEYKENFGEPQAGPLKNLWATYFDEKGRSVITRTLYYSSDEYVQSYIFDYAQGDDGQTVTATGIRTTARGKTLEKALLTDEFEHQMLTNPSFYNTNATNRHEMKFNKDGILVLYNCYSFHGPIEEKLVGKQNADKTWHFIKYKASGDACEENTRTYNANGQLVKLEYSQYGSNHYPYKGTIKTPPAGTYTYDAKGRWTGFQEPKPYKELKYQLVYNDKGDFTNSKAIWVEKNVHTSQKQQEQSESKEYSDYVYDSHGNWISRVVWNHQPKPRFIEKREIVYCNSEEELKEKAIQIYQTVSEKIKAQQKQ